MHKHMQHRSTSRPFQTITFVVLVLSITLGCARISELVKRGRDEGPPPTSTPTNGGTVPQTTDGDEADESALIKKTNAYITECFNRYSNRVVDSYNRYASWVRNMDQGPTGKEMNIYGLYDVNGDGLDCEKAVGEAKQLQPSMPELEDAADKYVVSLKSVIGQIRGVYKYYDQEDYKDDNFAKGKQSHAALVAAFKAFREANAVFADGVDNLEDQVAAEQLEKLKDVPSKRTEFLIVESGIRSKKIKTLLQDKQFEQITADELNPLIEDFEKTVEDLRTDASKQPMASTYISACEDFTKASKEMMRRIRDKDPFDSTERRQIEMGAGWMVDGSPDKIIKAYNDMIQRRRFMRF